MIPFMTGTHDIPPLYMLYAVVVHMDTLNASFSGHYVSYVKDLQGNWLRIDDSEVRVPFFKQRVINSYMKKNKLSSSFRTSPIASSIVECGF